MFTHANTYMHAHTQTCTHILICSHIKICFKKNIFPVYKLPRFLTMQKLFLVRDKHFEPDERRYITCHNSTKI